MGGDIVVIGKAEMGAHARRCRMPWKKLDRGKVTGVAFLMRLAGLQQETSRARSKGPRTGEG